MSQSSKFVVIEVTEQEPYGDVIGIFETAEAMFQFIEDTLTDGGSDDTYIRYVINTLSQKQWIQLAQGQYLRVQHAKYLPNYLGVRPSYRRLYGHH